MKAVNTPSKRRNSARTSRTEVGVALVLTLLVVAMLTVVVVGFTAVSRLEQISARNMTYQSTAEQLAQLATGKGMQRLSEAMKAGLAAPMFASQPGQINPFGAAVERLYSSGTANTNVNAFTADGLITGNSSDVVNVGVETVNDASGNAIGRIAYYVDDESTKIAVNQATGAANRTLNPQWPRPFAIQGANGVNNVRAAAFEGVLNYAQNIPSNSSNWSYFFTPEQLRGPLTAGPLPQLTVAVETNPASINTTPWGTQKIRINQIPLTDGGVQQLVQGLSDPKLAQVFGQTFADKYKPEGLAQIAANMLQLRTDHWRGGAKFNGVDPVLGTSQLTGPVNLPPTAGNAKKTQGIPQQYMGYVPFPMLSEIAVSHIFGWTAANLITVRFIVECTLTNPFPVPFAGAGSGIVAQIDKAIFPVYYPNNPGVPIGDRYRGPFGTQPSGIPYNSSIAANDPWGDGVGFYNNLVPPGGVATVPIPAMGAFAAATANLAFDVVLQENNATATVDTFFPSFVILDQIKLMANTNDPTSVRDWCSGYDLFNGLAPNGGGPAQFELPYSPVNLMRGAPGVGGANLDPATAPPPARKLSRYDPRLRPGLQASAIYKSTPPGKAWNYVGFAAMPPGPADFANDPIPSDPGNAQSVLYNANFPPILSASDGSYALAADLGKAYTGLPWRTLRMQPQPAREASAGLIPDWVMLDALTFGDGTRALNAANPNSQIVSAGSPLTNRTAAIRSQLDVLTNQTLNIVAHPITAGLTNAAPFSAASARALQTNAAGIGQIAVNAQRPDVTTSWSASSQWPARRAALGFPTNALLLPSELAEIRGMADFVPPANATNSEMNEYRLSALFPGAGARGRFYRVTALGEALEGKSANAPAAAKAFLQTLVEVNTNSSPPSIRIINQYPPAE